MKTNVKYASVAFTLAETLITIGMIGVIAALTLPTLMNSTNEKEIVTRVKKTRAIINEAYGRAVAKYGPMDSWWVNLPSGMTCEERGGKRITEFLQVEKDCGKSDDGCFDIESLKNINGDREPWMINNSIKRAYKFILSDNTSIAFKGNITINGVIDDFFVYFDIDDLKKVKIRLV